MNRLLKCTSFDKILLNYMNLTSLLRGTFLWC